MSTLRILLGIPTAGTPTEAFLAGLRGLELPPGVAALERSVAMGNFVPAQRELIMDDALAANADYLFFVDDDIALPPDALGRLLETIERDERCGIVGGLYYSRDSTRPIAVADWDSRDTSNSHIPAFTSTSTDVVDGVGFGCALLRVSAARALQPPYFPVHVHIERGNRRVRLCNEDYLYCERLREAGFTVRLDARVRCRHFDRASETSAPTAWEDDAITGVPRMLIDEHGVLRMVPFDPSVPRVAEHHVAADLSYISVD